MSTPVQSLSAEHIIEYLKENPEFFDAHPNTLKRLTLTHESGDAISLIERQNQILRKENTTLIDRLNQFIDVAQRNDRLFQKLQHLVISLISCQTLDSLCKALSEGLLTHFDVDAVQIVFTIAPAVAEPNGWTLGDNDELLEHFSASLKEQRHQCGEFDTQTRALLFSDPSVKSIAIGALTQHGQSVGLLALGSEDSNYFRSSTDTLFLGHLSLVVSQLLNRVSG